MKKGKKERFRTVFFGDHDVQVMHLCAMTLLVKLRSWSAGVLSNSCKSTNTLDGLSISSTWKSGQGDFPCELTTIQISLIHNQISFREKMRLVGNFKNKKVLITTISIDYYQLL